MGMLKKKNHLQHKPKASFPDNSQRAHHSFLPLVVVGPHEWFDPSDILSERRQQRNLQQLTVSHPDPFRRLFPAFRQCLHLQSAAAVKE